MATFPAGSTTCTARASFLGLHALSAWVRGPRRPVTLPPGPHPPKERGVAHVQERKKMENAHRKSAGRWNASDGRRKWWFPDGAIQSRSQAGRSFPLIAFRCLRSGQSTLRPRQERGRTGVMPDAWAEYLKISSFSDSTHGQVKSRKLSAASSFRHGRFLLGTIVVYIRRFRRLLYF